MRVYKHSNSEKVMKQINWSGVFPAVTTKFKEDESLDMSAFFKNLDAQLEAGVDGFILGGTLGEAGVLTEAEKYELLEATVNYVGGKVPVLLNIAESTTKNAIRCARKAETLGASGLMLLPPLRYYSDFEETLAYFEAVAQNTHLPIMLYNNPVDYKTFISLEMFERLEKYPNIQAVKESTRDTTNVIRMVNKFGDRFKILTGVDTLALESLLLGAHGWVAGLVDAFPKETVAIFRLAKAHRVQEALDIYRWFMPVLELDIHPKLVQYIKLAEVATGIGTEKTRAPRLALVGAERERVLKVLEVALANRPTLPEGTWGIK